MNTNLDKAVALSLGWKHRRVTRAAGDRRMVWVDPQGAVYSWVGGLPEFSTDLNILIEALAYCGRGWAVTDDCWAKVWKKGPVTENGMQHVSDCSSPAEALAEATVLHFKEINK